MSVPPPASIRGILQAGSPVVLVECMARDAHVSLAFGCHRYWMALLVFTHELRSLWNQQVVCPQACRTRLSGPVILSECGLERSDERRACPGRCIEGSSPDFNHFNKEGFVEALRTVSGTSLRLWTSSFQSRDSLNDH